MTKREMMQAVGPTPKALCKLAVLSPAIDDICIYCPEFVDDIRRLTKEKKPLLLLIEWDSDRGRYWAKYSKRDGWSRDWGSKVREIELQHMTWFQNNNFDIEAMI